MRKQLFLLSLFLCAALFAADVIKLQLDSQDGFYRSGESVSCTATVLRDGKPLANSKVNCLVLVEATKVREDVLDTDEDGIAGTSYTMTKPGWVSFRFYLPVKPGEKPKYTDCGAIFDKDKLFGMQKTCPPDLEAFWKKSMEDLAKVPMDILALDPLPENDIPARWKKKVKCYSFTVRSLGTENCTGYLAVPICSDKKRKFPAVAVFQSHSENGVSPNHAMSNAASGAISIIATWHGLPVGKDRQFYVNTLRGKNPDYPRYRQAYGNWGIESAHTWYWRNAYLRVLRELQFLKSRPEWNKKDLIVIGGSLAGARSTIAAALDCDVTLAIISVPGFCDINGSLEGRDGGFPFSNPWGPKQLNAHPERRKVIAYLDCIHLAKLIKCPTYVCTGFRDYTCPPSNVIAFYNNLPKNIRHLSTNPYTGHGGTTPNTLGDQRMREFWKTVTWKP